MNKDNSPWSLSLNPGSSGHPRLSVVPDKEGCPIPAVGDPERQRSALMRCPSQPPRTRRFFAKEGVGSRRGGYLPDQSEARGPALRAGGPSLTPAVGGGGGASRAAAEGAGPRAWRRGLGLSVPRLLPPPPPPRFLTCRGPGGCRRCRPPSVAQASRAASRRAGPARR